MTKNINDFQSTVIDEGVPFSHYKNLINCPQLKKNRKRKRTNE